MSKQLDVSKFLLLAILSFSIIEWVPSKVFAQDTYTQIRRDEDLIKLFAGNFMPNSYGGGHYFAPDGKLYLIEPSINQIAMGRWVLAGPGPGRKMCLVYESSAYIKQGKVHKFKADRACMVVFQLADKTLALRLDNNKFLYTPKLTKGFPLMRQFERLRKKMGM